MPLSVTFTKDLESDRPIHSHFLMGKLYQPAFKVLEEAKKMNLDPKRLMNDQDMAHRRNCLVPPKTLAMWMFEFVQDLEREMKEEEFHFEFAYYISITECSAESEYAIRASSPMWFVTIRDFEKSIVHKNWTIAFDDWADIIIKRGKATREDPMSNAPHFTHYEEMKCKVFSSIKEHVRLRNFRLTREQNNNKVGTRRD